MPIHVVLTGLAALLSWLALGGGIYEFTVVDPAWPKRPDIIQPSGGGLNRARFWIPAHMTFELTLLAALAAAWSSREVRTWLLAALGCQVVLRAWSFADLIPKAIAFERAPAGAVDEAAALRWTQRSLLRLPLHAAACACVSYALLVAATSAHLTAHNGG
jgi:hypothetical protein